jgi:hypothetical protein
VIAGQSDVIVVEDYASFPEIANGGLSNVVTYSDY